MVRIHKSARGKPVDMEAMRVQNEKVVAVTGGTQNVNSRGDVLGEGGKIIKTREEVLTSYNRVNPNAVADDVKPAVNITADVLTVPVSTVEEEDVVSAQERLEFEEMAVARAEDSNARVAALREKRQHDAFISKATQEQLDELTQDSIDLIPPDMLPDEPEIVITEVVLDEIVSVTEIFVDEVTGKEYKTKRGLKTAVDKREKALAKKDNNNNDGKAKVEWS